MTVCIQIQINNQNHFVLRGLNLKKKKKNDQVTNHHTWFSSEKVPHFFRLFWTLMTACIKIKISSQNHFVVRGLSFQTMNKLPISINGSVQRKSHSFPLGWSNMAAKHGFSLFASMVETKIQYVLIKVFVISPFVLTLTVQNKVTVSYNSFKRSQI